MTSLRVRLFLLVAATTTLVWSLAAGWTVLSARADVEAVLDRRLREAAVMVASLGYSDEGGRLTSPNPVPIPMPSYERQLSCQIWSVSGNLLGMSEGAPAKALSTGEAGFSEPVIDGVRWRVYTHVGSDSGLRVMVGDTKAMRSRLIANLLEGLILPVLGGLVALAVLLWIGVGRGLSPLRRIASAIGARAPDDPGPLQAGPVPRELAPLTEEIDDLFSRIAGLRSVEKRFLASAAHEMQTPLAGLLIHADIALRAEDEATRQRALERIRLSVDRTARLVRQLLELSRHEASREDETGSTSLGEAALIVEEELSHILAQRRVTIHVSTRARAMSLPFRQDALVIALRNLVENAVLHGPTDSVVRVDVRGEGFVIEDDGIGFTPGDSGAMIQAFARGNTPAAPGSGLGLAIAAAALAPRFHLSFERDEQGFRAVATS